jgi:hypothetical protein
MTPRISRNTLIARFRLAPKTGYGAPTTMKAYLAAVIVLGLPMSPLAAADPKEAPKLPSPEIIKAWSAADAWKDAGAVVGGVKTRSRTHESPSWVPPMASFRLDFQAQNIGAIKGMPVFHFADWKTGVLVKLPDPGFAFGLMLSSRKLTGVELNRGLQELSGLEGLQALYLWDTKVTDSEMKEIAKLKNLQTLDLGDTQVTDQGLKVLAGMKNLQTLNLSGTQVTDAGLNELAGVKSLQALYLVGTKVKGSGLKELAGLKNLQVLLSIPEQVRNAVERSLLFMENGAMKWQKEMKCAGCHLVTTNIWTQSEARSRGFKIQDEALDPLRDWAISWDKPGAENAAALEDRDGSGSDLNTVYLMLASTAATKLDDKTAAALRKMSAYILSRQAADGSWKLVDILSPPIIDVGEVQTMQALLALAAAHEKGLVDEKAWTSARDRALAWLGKNKFLDQNQSWNLRVLVAQRFGKPEEVQALVKQLLEQQNADGGWSQTRDRPSDAMATGQTLYALTTAGVSSQGPAVQRAQAFLIYEQTAPSGKDKEGGFWQVNSRVGSKNIMTTTFGTGWAVLGLMRTLPRQGDKQGNTGTPTKADPTPAEAKK